MKATHEAYIRQRVREHLHRLGHTDQYQKNHQLLAAVEAEWGRKCPGDETDYYRAWMASLDVPGRREPPKFRPLTIKPLSAMQINLDRAAKSEPKMQAISGRPGNGPEPSLVWRR